jgi:hypothetical protein
MVASVAKITGGFGSSGLPGFDMAGSLLGGGGSAGGGAASAGLFANPVGLALAGGQLAFGIANMIQQGKVREQQAYNQAYNTEFTNKINQFRTEQRNQQIAAAFNAKLDFTKQQIENNYLAAQASWTSEQMRLNDIYGRAAYKSQALQKMLVESMGTAAAREVYGKSAKRGAAVATLGAYGRSRAQLVDQLMSENVASTMRRQRVEQQFKAQNKLAIAQTSVLPTFASFSPTPHAAPMGAGGFQTASNILGIGMQSFGAGLSVTPKGMNFLGVPGQANYG